jgi:hypothetical protein
MKNIFISVEIVFERTLREERTRIVAVNIIQDTLPVLVEIYGWSLDCAGAITSSMDLRFNLIL